MNKLEAISLMTQGHKMHYPSLPEGEVIHISPIDGNFYKTHKEGEKTISFLCDISHYDFDGWTDKGYEEFINLEDLF